MSANKTVDLLKDLVGDTKWGSVLVAGLSAGQAQYILLSTAGADQRTSLIGAVFACASALIACKYDASKKASETSNASSKVEKVVEMAAGSVIPPSVSAVLPDLAGNIAKEASRLAKRGIKW